MPDPVIGTPAGTLVVDRPAQPDFDVVVGEKSLKEFPIAFLPRFPGLFFHIDQSFFERIFGLLSLREG